MPDAWDGVAQVRLAVAPEEDQNMTCGACGFNSAVKEGKAEGFDWTPLCQHCLEENAPILTGSRPLGWEEPT